MTLEQHAEQKLDWMREQDQFEHRSENYVEPRLNINR